jgi:hypothetical protein
MELLASVAARELDLQDTSHELDGETDHFHTRATFAHVSKSANTSYAEERHQTSTKKYSRKLLCPEATTVLGKWPSHLWCDLLPISLGRFSVVSTEKALLLECSLFPLC